MAEANDLTVGTMAMVAQQEREAIPRRTQEPLAAVMCRSPVCALDAAQTNVE